jgi:uncharacterized protein (DUF427 family)
MAAHHRLEPGPGQESVWDYPRPPKLEATSSHVEVTLAGICVARTDRALRVLETSHPPTYYLPVDSFAPDSLKPARGTSFCEWKGNASYFDVVAADVVAARAAWGYPNPTPEYARLVDHVALYSWAMDACTVDGEAVVSQPGDFYGGWITSRVVGPFKGDPGTRFW